MAATSRGDERARPYSRHMLIGFHDELPAVRKEQLALENILRQKPQLPASQLGLRSFWIGLSR